MTTSQIVFYVALALCLISAGVLVFDILKGKFNIPDMACIVLLCVGVFGVYMTQYGIKVETVDDYIAGLQTTTPNYQSTESYDMNDYTGADQTTGKQDTDQTTNTIDQSTDQTTNQSADQTTNQSTNNTNTQSNNQAGNQTGNQTNDATVTQNDDMDNHFDKYYSNGQITVEPGTYDNNDGSSTTVTKNADGTYTLRTDWADGGYQTMTY